ncbi:MAG: hypothetical protein RMJ54_14285 [Roseiflexaceae bacterium]|nr:hypothetical protein [Roseiflexaceae bacterium]
MVAEALQAVGEVRRTAILEIGANQQRQRHADGRARHEVRVEGFDGWQAEQEAASCMRPLLQALQSIGEGAGAVETHDYHCYAGERVAQ